MRRRIWLAGALACVCSVAPVRAQDRAEVKAQVDNTRVDLGSQVNLQIIISGGGMQTERPELPAIPGFSAFPTGQSQSFTMVNGVTTSQVAYSYLLTAIALGSHRIPAIHVVVGQAAYETPPIDMQVVPATSAPAPPPQANPGLSGMPWSPPAFRPQPAPAPQIKRVFVEASVSDEHPYVNEPVLYTFKFFHAVNLAGQPNFEPAESIGFLREEMGQRTYTENRDGVEYSVSEVRTMVFPSSAGDYTIGSTRLTCQLRPSVDAVSFLFEDATPRELVTRPITLHVKPLPTQGKPDDFSGAVGQFTIKASIEPGHIREGQSATLTVHIDGTGHPDLIGDLALPPYPNLKLYPNHTETTLPDKSLRLLDFRASKTVTYPMVASKAGSYKLQGIRLSYFDPNRGRYEIAEASPPSLAVAVDPNAKPAPEASAAPSSSSTPESKIDHEQDLLHAVKATAGDLRPDAPALTSRGWFWALQLLPGALLLGYFGARRASAAARALSERRRYSRASLRYAGAARALAPDQVDRANALIFEYLREKTGEPLAALSLGQLQTRLGERGVSKDTVAFAVERLEQLEARRYAPPGESGVSTPPGQMAAEVIERLERELR